MNYLAIRNDDYKNVYYFNTKGEKGRILSKFPKASNRIFLEEEKNAALKWAGVEDIASEEDNTWAITKQNVVNNTSSNVAQNQIETQKEEVKETKVNETQIDVASPMQTESKSIEDNTIKKQDVVNENEEFEETIVPKHVLSDFEKIIEIYKKNGVKLLEITLVDNSKYCLLTDDLYYFKNWGENSFGDVPFSSKNEQDLKVLILEQVQKEKDNGNKNISFNSFLQFDMFDRIPKTKYLAFGDLVYANDLNYVKQFKSEIFDTVEYYLETKNSNKNVTFSTTNVVSMKPIDVIDFIHVVREREFSLFIKKSLKQIEKQKKSNN